MARSAIAVRRIDGSSGEDIECALDILLRSFTDDRAIEAMVAGDKSLKKALFQLSIDRSFRDGECYLAYDGDDVCGVAVWIAPGSEWRFHDDPAFSSQLSDELQEWYIHHYAPKWEDLYQSAGSASTSARKQAWKIQWVGVLPHHRGKGACKALIEAVARKADSQNRPIVAEVSNPDYVQRFRGSGFIYRSVKNFMSSRFAGFPIWYLVREPYSGSPTNLASPPSR